MTVVRPSVRFVELSFKENLITRFEEKPQAGEGWVNRGFFILESEVLNYIGEINEPLDKKTF